MIVNDLDKLKDIEFYSYCDDRKGNIEIMFRISDEEQYRLVVTEKDLKSMLRFSKLGKEIKRSELHESIKVEKDVGKV